MMNTSVTPLLALLLITLPSFAHADFHVTSLSATGYYLHNGASESDASSGPPSSIVNVQRFDTNYTSGFTGYHSYGSDDGSFGSRSSGYGYYNVFSAFNIKGTFTNTSADAQHVLFSFDITPGMLNNEINTPFVGSQYVESGVKFSVESNGHQVFLSGASLRTDSTGTLFMQTGIDLYTQTSATNYNIDAYHQVVDLGELNAGESLQISYDLSTYANGDSGSVSGLITRPAQTIVVPDQTVFIPAHDEFTYVQSGTPADEAVIDPLTGLELRYGCSNSQEVCGLGYYTRVPERNEFVPGYSYDVSELTEFVIDQVSGSHASSGDPFEFYSNGAPNFSGKKAGLTPISFITASVPEPESLAMLIAGLGLMGWRIRHNARK